MTNTTDRELCERLITKLQDIAHGRCRNLDIIQETCRKGAAILEHPSSRERQLEEALRFYADHENWWGVYIAGSKSAMVEDWGHPTDDFPDGKPGIRARQALSQSPITEPVDAMVEALAKCNGLQSNGGNGGRPFVRVYFDKPGDQDAFYSLVSAALRSPTGDDG